VTRTAPAREESSDAALLTALRSGDEAAFAGLVDRLSPGLLRVAQAWLSTRAAAEDVVQETWLTVITGLSGFEERSRLSTWVFGICINLARKSAAKERRTLPFSSLPSSSLPFSSLAPEDDTGPAVSADRFRPPGDPDWPRRWASVPRPWETDPAGRLLATETRQVLAEAMAVLPARQRLVVFLRDVHGLAAEEVSALLEVSPGNQRLLLHRGRSTLRATLERYLDPAT
jgi:RNA polymerase sigma-70 factor, ECF subfamily